MQKTCTVCGAGFEAKRAAKYCGERCKKRAQRLPGAKLVSLPSPPPEIQRGSEPGTLEQATRRSLENAGRLDSDLGMAAMLLARRLDANSASAVDSGVGVAALAKEYRATLADAVKDVEPESDGAVEEIRASALRLIDGFGA